MVSLSLGKRRWILMDKQTAKIFPTLVNGYTLQSVKDNLDSIIGNINSVESHHAGEYGSFTLDQNLLT